MSEIDKLITITLDKERHLRLTLKGMVEFEKLTGGNLLKGFDFNALTLEDSAALVWACLIHEDKELTFDDVLCMIDMSNLTVVMESLMQCIVQSMPEVEKSETSKSPLAETSHPG